MARQLDVADAVRHFVRDDFPAPVAVQRDGIRIQQRQRLPVFAHFRQTALHEFRHQSHTGIFRIGRHARDESDGVHGGMDVHFQRIDRELRNEGLAVETAPDVGAFQNREFRLLDVVFFPSVILKVLFRDLEGVTQQGVVLVQIVGCQFPDMKIAFDHDVPVTCAVLRRVVRVRPFLPLAVPVPGAPVRR